MYYTYYKCSGPAVTHLYEHFPESGHDISWVEITETTYSTHSQLSDTKHLMSRRKQIMRCYYTVCSTDPIIYSYK